MITKLFLVEQRLNQVKNAIELSNEHPFGKIIDIKEYPNCDGKTLYELTISHNSPNDMFWLGVMVERNIPL